MNDQLPTQSAADFAARIATLEAELAEARRQQIATTDMLQAELTEALAHQTASADILSIISKGHTDTRAVFDAIAANALKLCGGTWSAVELVDGKYLRLAALHNVPNAAGIDAIRSVFPMPISSSTVAAEVVRTGVPVQNQDVQESRHPHRDSAPTSNYRSGLGIPMLQNGKAIGVVFIARDVAGPFPERQIDVLKTFASQAVIAIENARLFEAEQARTRELQESLAYQRGGAEVLRAIAGSPGRIEPVLDAIASIACDLCAAHRATVWLSDAGVLRLAGHSKLDEVTVQHLTGNPIKPSSASIVGRVVESKATVQVTDVMSDPEIIYAKAQPGVRPATMLGVPLLRQGEFLGVISVVRTEVEPFTDQQVKLISTFADQAVIAIENVRLFEAEQARTRELQESLEYQKAISEVLGVISASPNALQPVFDAIVQTATRLCDADRSILRARQGDEFPVAAHFGLKEDELASYLSYPVVPTPGNLWGAAVTEGRTIHNPDTESAPMPERPDGPTRLSVRSGVSVPLVRSGMTIGALTVTREKARAFDPRQLRLLETFASQAVIAIENARLFEAEQARTRELQASLKQQTATADVLKSISRSTFDLPKVLDTLVEAAARLCNADKALIRRREGEAYALAATYGHTEEFKRIVATVNVRPGRNSIGARVALEKRTVNVPDVLEDAEFDQQQWQQVGNFRSSVGIPLLRDGDLLGFMLLQRTEADPFSAAQIALLETFADQAVIAIENARLFEAEQARTRELGTALEQQTAVGEVLKTISRAPFDLDKTLITLVETAARLCDADMGVLRRRVGELFPVAASYGWKPEWRALLDANATAPGPDSAIGRAALTGATAHVHDVLAEPGFNQRNLEAQKVVGFRTNLAVPLRRDGQMVGTLSIQRLKVRPFTPQQIALFETFADQAVIAIENARLFEAEQARTKELQESLEYQTAISDVLGVIARSPTELQPVLDQIVRTAAELGEADIVGLRRRDGDRYQLAAHRGYTDEQVEWLVTNYATPKRGILFEVIRTRETKHVTDAASPEREQSLDIVNVVGNRTALGVPLLRHGELIGTLFLGRREPRPFADRQIKLIETFANQAVIAINNVGLFEEVQARTKELQESLEYQTATSEVLSVISKSPDRLQPVLDTIVSIGARLCAAEYAILFNVEGDCCPVAASNNTSADFIQALYDKPVPIFPGSTTGWAVLEKRTIHVEDVLTWSDYARHETQRVGRHRTVLSVPLLRSGAPVGVLTLMRSQVSPFSDKQVRLVETFADQAVIAINNVGLFEEVQARTKELQESLEYQTATSEVLSVISRSPNELQPVLDAIAATARELCDAENSFILRLRPEDGQFHVVAAHSSSPEFIAHVKANPAPAGRGSVTGRAAVEKRPVHIVDTQSDPEFTYFDSATQHDSTRTRLGVPLLKGADVIGVIVVNRRDVKPFTQRQIDLVATFADQAVIAINNVGLFEEVQARTKELQESLAYQTATSEVLSVISKSPNELQQVLDSITEIAQRLCMAERVTLWRLRGDTFELAASNDHTYRGAEFVQQNPPLTGRRSLAGRAVLAKSTLHIADALSDAETPPEALARIRIVGSRTMLCVPLLREGEPIGVFILGRSEVRPFTERQVSLVETFADQAVIAIENARLFEAEQTRTKELQESLERQTATGEVLSVIARSPTEIQPVLETIVATARKLCSAERALVWRIDAEVLRPVAHDGLPPDRAEAALHHSTPSDAGSMAGRAVLAGRAVQVVDVTSEPGLDHTYDWNRSGNLRTVLATPLLRKGEAIGAITVSRTRMEPFSDKHVSLLETFADQAVIAIENARLFEEVQTRTKELAESLRQQTATADVLKAISRSVFDLQPVLDTLVRSAAKLCSADHALIRQRTGENYYVTATEGFSPEQVAHYKSYSPRPVQGSIFGRAVLNKRTEHVPDILADPQFERSASRLIGLRAVAVVPLLRDGDVIGVFSLMRVTPRPFTATEIALVETFADQAVIAIENARLLDELQTRQRELEKSLERQTATTRILSAISASPGHVEPVFQEILTSARELCEAEFGHLLLCDSAGWRPVALQNLPRAYADFWNTAAPIVASPATLLGQITATRRPVQLADALSGPGYQERSPLAIATVELGGARTLFGVPLLKEDRVVGAIVLYRKEVRPFDDKQIGLLSSFADQAVIAIENARLLEELQTRQRELEERSAELSESLDYQTAISDMLAVVASSSTNVQPVFQIMAENAVRLCGSLWSTVHQFDGKLINLAAQHNLGTTEGIAEVERAFPRPPGNGLVDQAIRTRNAVYLRDFRDEPNYPHQAALRATGMRSMLAVPLLNADRAVGAISVASVAPDAFTERHASLLKAFADQAVIAIENARLLDELQARQRELTESLEYQTATSEVLGVISRSPNELQPVLDTIVATAERLCEGDRAQIFIERDGQFSLAAHSNTEPHIVAHFLANPIVPGRSTATARAALEGRTVHVPDVTADPEYDPEGFHTMLGGSRLVVPLRRAGKTMGLIAIPRRVAKPFTDRQIALVTTFADQAVIAINNVGLFEEVQARTKDLQESLEYQTATSEVLGVISSSPRELQPVLDAIVATAGRLCEADYAHCRIEADGLYHVRAAHAHNPDEIAGIPGAWAAPVAPNLSSVSGRAALECRTIHVPDVHADLDNTYAVRTGITARTMLGVPLVRDARAIGVLTLFRKAVRPFTSRQIDLVTTFANQAVIAINNVGLFEEVQARTKDLQESLEYQTATSEVLGVISRSPNELQPVLNAIMETAARLCRADSVHFRLLKDGVYHLVASHLDDSDYIARLKDSPIVPGGDSVAGRVALIGATVHLPNVQADQMGAYTLQSGNKARAALGVPLLRDGRVVGVIVLFRNAAEPFAQYQIDLVTTFANQAVIAISNVGLFEEVQARSRDLARSVEELRSLGEVGRAVSSSLDMQKVLSTILEHACRITDTSGGTIYVYDKLSETFQVEAAHNMLEEHLARVREHPMRIGDPVVGECAARREAIQVPDLTKEDSDRSPLFGILTRGGTRALLAVPLLHQGEAFGALVVRRGRAGEFPPETVRLLETFAAQSAIAVNNARLFNEIRDKSRQLELASQHKSQFLANMSHELRTPLNAILGYAELMADGAFGEIEGEQRETIERIERNGKHLLGLINDVLDLSKIEAGEMALAVEEYSLASLVRTAIVATEPLARQKGLGLDAFIAEGMPVGHGDTRRLAQVLLNLIGNAIKFTDRGGITISANCENEVFRIDVRDTGPGIASDDLGRIFEKFQQVDNTSTRKKGGTGLGLAISREFIEMHGGTISVASVLGEGAVFTITLPVGAPAGRAV